MQLLMILIFHSNPFLQTSLRSSQPEALTTPPLNSMSQFSTPAETLKPASATNYGVVLTGSVASGLRGPTVGAVDISESEDMYYFRVSLVGVPGDSVSCEISRDGQILIKGVTTTGEKTVYRDGMEFEMLTQNFNPPGPFTVSFKLPGPVGPHELATHVEDGILEGSVKKMNAAD